MSNILEVIQVTKSNLLEVFNTGKYGSIVVQYTEPGLKDMAEEAGKILNYLHKDRVVFQKPFVVSDVRAGSFVENESEGLHQITFTQNVIETISWDFMALKMISESVKIAKTLKVLEIPPTLAKYCRGLVSGTGVKFISKNGEYFFDASPKKLSLTKKLKQHYSAGDRLVILNKNDYNLGSVRCTCSNLSAELGEKISCSIVDGNISVTFGSHAEARLRQCIESVINESGIEVLHQIIESALTGIGPTEATHRVNAVPVPGVAPAYGNPTDETPDTPPRQPTEATNDFSNVNWSEDEEDEEYIPEDYILDWNDDEE